MFFFSMILMLSNFANANIIANLIQNGGFEDQVITANFVTRCPLHWNCSNINIITSQSSDILYGQYIDMESSMSPVCNLSQYVTIHFAGNCTLELYQSRLQLYDPSQYNTLMEVWWNAYLVGYVYQTTFIRLKRTFTFQVDEGVGLLLFREIGSPDNIGTNIDNVSLICDQIDNMTQNQDQNQIENEFQNYLFPKGLSLVIAIFLSTPLSGVSSFHNVFLFLEDFWLYNYDIRNYTGTINDVFVTVDFIEALKFQILQQVVDLTPYKTNLRISNFTSYTNSRFLKNEDGASFVFMDSNFAFFVCTIPQNILTSLIFFGIFMGLKTYRFSSIFKRYYYIKLTLLITLFHDNIGYFSYVCFAHMRSCFFSLTCFDRLWMMLSVVILFMLLGFTFCFFFLVAKYLRKQSNSFRQEIRRCLDGNIYLSLKYPLRGLLRGVVFFFFRNFYQIQVVCLAAIEFAVIATAIVFQKKSKIFPGKLLFVRCLTYHLFHLLLNVGFLLEPMLEDQQQLQQVRKMLEIIIYILVGVSWFGLISDFISAIIIFCKSRFKRYRFLILNQQVRKQKEKQLKKYLPKEQIITKQNKKKRNKVELKTQAQSRQKENTQKNKKGKGKETLTVVEASEEQYPQLQNQEGMEQENSAETSKYKQIPKMTKFGQQKKYHQQQKKHNKLHGHERRKKKQ